MDALFELPAPAERELGLRRACQVALLRDRLQAAGRRKKGVGSRSRRGNDSRPLFCVDWLQTLTLADLARHATPFFWLNVVRCHAACGRADRGLSVAVRYLLVTGFDAFFAAAPDGFSCPLPAGEDAIIVLPRLGVRLAATEGPVRLCRVGREALRVECDGGRGTTVPLDDVPAEARLRWLPVGSDRPARLLLDSHPALFPGADAAGVLADPAGHAAMIASALELIRQTDPRRGEQIAAAVRWYVPLASSNPEVRRSHTLRHLGGVIFLSPGRERWVVAESIVHEYYHGVLNARMELEKLLAGGGEARFFYSPWRPDPRPLSGLLHALYVFAGIAEFLLRAEADRASAEQHGAIRDRRRTVVEQLRLGHAQAPPELFTPPGRELLEGLREVIDRHAAELGLSADQLPDALAAHLREWCASHPRLAAGVRRPVRSGA